jgi:hypothetical protein
VAVNQALSPLFSRATSSALSAAVNRAETREFSAAVSQDVNAFLNLAVNRAASRAASSGLTYAFSRESSPALNRALSVRSSVALSTEANAAVPVRVLCPAVPHARNSCEQHMILARASVSVPFVVSPRAPRLLGKAAAVLACFEAHTAIYMW